VANGLDFEQKIAAADISLQIQGGYFTTNMPLKDMPYLPEVLLMAYINLHAGKIGQGAIVNPACMLGVRQ
jgi:hypothetical protein